RARDSGERHLLRVGAVRISRLQSERLELFRDVFNGKLFAFRSGRAAFEFIGSENFDVLEQVGGGNGVGCSFRRKRRLIGGEGERRQQQTKSKKAGSRFHRFFS